MNRINLVVAVLLIGVGVAFAGLLLRDRERTRIARDAVPALPDFGRLPPTLASRIRLASQAASAGPAAPGALEELALLYHANGFWSQAEQIETALSRLEPKDSRWPYYLADLNLSRGDDDNAIRLLDRTLAMSPENAAAELKFANLFLRTNRVEEAARHYQRRLRLMPDDPYARLGLARIALLRSDSQEAIATLEKLLRDSPTFYTAHNLLAEIYSQGGNAAAASKERQAGAHAPRFQDADDPLLDQLLAYTYDPYQLQVRGAIQMQTGHLAESLPLYQKAVRMRPDDGSGYDGLADVLLQLGRLDEARAVLQRGIAVAPRLYSLYTSLALILRRQDQSEQAAQLLKSAAAQLPESPEIRNDLGLTLEAAGNSGEAISAYREALRLNPNFAEAHLNLGLCLQTLDRSSEAEQHIRRALELSPGNRTALLAAANADFAAQRWESARRRLELLLALDQDQSDARTLLAQVHLNLGLNADRAGDTSAAERQFLAGIDVDATVPELHANLGVLLTRQARMTEAGDCFRRFLELAPADPIAYLYLGQALIADHRSQEATDILTRGIVIAERAGDDSAAARLRAVLEMTRH